MPNAFRLIAVVALAGALGTGCTTTTVIDASSVPAKSVGAEFSEEQLLDIGVALFDEAQHDALKAICVDPVPDWAGRSVRRLS